MTKEIIQTKKAPKAIGTYSQAVKVDHTVYLSGQIPLVPETMTIIEGDAAAQITRVFDNLKAVAEAAGGGLADIVKLNVFLLIYQIFPWSTKSWALFSRALPGACSYWCCFLPKDVEVEMDAIMFLKPQEYPAS